MGSRLWGLGRNQDGQLLNTTKINANRPKPAVSPHHNAPPIRARPIHAFIEVIYWAPGPLLRSS